MVIFLILLCGAFLFFAFGTLLFSKSAIHEILGSLLLLVAILCLIAASILAELRRIRRAVTEIRETDEDEEDQAAEEETEEEGAEDHEDERTSISRKCPSCGRRNVASATRCGCGWSLVWAEEET